MKCVALRVIVEHIVNECSIVTFSSKPCYVVISINLLRSRHPQTYVSSFIIAMFNIEKCVYIIKVMLEKKVRNYSSFIYISN